MRQEQADQIVRIDRGRQSMRLSIGRLVFRRDEGAPNLEALECSRAVLDPRAYAGRFGSIGGRNVQFVAGFQGLAGDETHPMRRNVLKIARETRRRTTSYGNDPAGERPGVKSRLAAPGGNAFQWFAGLDGLDKPIRQLNL